MARDAKKGGRSVESALRILREVTLTVKLLPFAYTAVYLLTMAAYCLTNETVIAMYDILFYVSPLVVVTLFHLSYQLRLCVWHRIQCAMPLLPQVVGAFDRYVYSFGEYSALALTGLIIAILILSLVNAHRLFIAR